jgi:lactocepin
VTMIGDSAFGRRSSLTRIEIPPGVTTIGESAFEGCSGSTHLEIPPMSRRSGSPLSGAVQVWRSWRSPRV